MKPGEFAVVGCAESTDIGRVPDLSSTGLLLDAASRALTDAGLRPSDIDGLTTGYLPVGNVAQLLGIRPTWVDSTVVGGCSWMMQLRNAMAAIAAGYCNIVLLTHGESGRSHVMPQVYDIGAAGSTEQQFDFPYAGTRAALFALSLLRYMDETGLTDRQLASVVVAQRRWAALNPRATLKDAIDVDEVLASPNVCWPILRSMCCLISDAGGAMILCSAERAKDFPKPPVYVLGTGAAVETGVASPTGIADPMRPGLIGSSGSQAFASAHLSPTDIDHVMIYDAFAHLPIFALEGLGFLERGAGGVFFEEGHSSPGGRLPVNTNGGGLAYAHSGSYGMHCMLESVRQLRGEAAAQVEGVRTSLAHGWGGFWSACSTIIFANERC